LNGKSCYNNSAQLKGPSDVCDLILTTIERRMPDFLSNAVLEGCVGYRCR